MSPTLNRFRRRPFDPRSIYGIAREVRDALADLRPLLLAGAPGPASALREELVRGGDPAALRDAAGRSLSDHDLRGASAVAYALEREPSRDDVEALKRAVREDVRVVCLLSAARGVSVPYVTGDDVVLWEPGRPLPIERVAERLAEALGESAYALAARLPALRRPASEAVVRRFARQNGVLGAAIFIPGADLPALTLNQVRMVLRIAAAYGEDIDRERALELLAVFGAGFGFRAAARQALALVPGPGWALKGGVAYTGTLALGRAAIAYFERRGAQGVRGSVRRRS